MAKLKETPDAWTDAWLEAVVDGRSTMSQRKLSTVEKRGGGLAACRRAAKKRGVHLLLLTDDRGDELVAASKHPFKVVC